MIFFSKNPKYFLRKKIGGKKLGKKTYYLLFIITTVSYDEYMVIHPAVLRPNNCVNALRFPGSRAADHAQRLGQ
jgi:hypothetical protein